MKAKKIEQMYKALKRITMYESVKQLRRNSEEGAIWPGCPRGTGICL